MKQFLIAISAALIFILFASILLNTNSINKEVEIKRFSLHYFIKKKALSEAFTSNISEGSTITYIYFNHYEEAFRIEEDRQIKLTGWKAVRIECHENSSVYYYQKTK